MGAKTQTGSATISILALWFMCLMSHAGLIGHWKFDEGSGTTAADASGFGNTATDTGAAWVTGVSSYAVDDPRFSLADSSDLILSGSVPFTISFWIKPPDSSQSFTCYAGFEGTSGEANDSYAIKCNGSDKPQLTPSGTTAPDTIWNYSDSGSNWVHVVGVHEPGVNSRMYINGTEVATGSAGSIPNPANHDFTIGSYPSGSYGLDASLDDVQVYDHALPDADVLSLYNNPGSPLGAAVSLSNDSIVTNASPGTLVGNLSMVYTNGVFSYSMVGGGDNDYFDIVSGATNLRTAAWIDSASYSISIIGTESGGGGLVVTNDFTINVTPPVADDWVFIVSSEVQNGAADGTLVGTAKTLQSGATFSISGGREDLFYFEGAELKLTNSASWGSIGTTNYVTLQAAGGSVTNEMVVAASVISGATSGTVFLFR